MTTGFDPTLYSTIAQVLPLLLVVVFVDLLRSEAHRDSDSPRGHIDRTRGAPFLLASLALVTCAEIACLVVLKERKPPNGGLRLSSRHTSAI